MTNTAFFAVNPLHGGYDRAANREEFLAVRIGTAPTGTRVWYRYGETFVAPYGATDEELFILEPAGLAQGEIYLEEPSDWVPDVLYKETA